jgi:hypothetical protein
MFFSKIRGALCLTQALSTSRMFSLCLGGTLSSGNYPPQWWGISLFETPISFFHHFQYTWHHENYASADSSTCHYPQSKIPEVSNP